MPEAEAAVEQPECSHVGGSAARDTRFGGLFGIKNKVEAVVPSDPAIPCLLTSLRVLCQKATGTSRDCGE